MANANNLPWIELKDPELKAMGDAMQYLILALGAKKLVQLACLLKDVSGDTHHGQVKIDIYDGRVGHLRAEKTYE